MEDIGRKIREAAGDPEFRRSLGELKRQAKESASNILFKNTADGTKRFVDKAQKIAGKKKQGIGGIAASTAIAGTEESLRWVWGGTLEISSVLIKTVKTTFYYLRALAR